MTTPRRRKRQPRAGSIGPGISPKANAANAYERELRRKVLNPWVARIQRRIDSAGANYERIRQEIANIPLDPQLEGLSRASARQHMDRMKRAHKAEFTRKMSRYLGVNVGPMTPDLGVERLMEKAISDNVNLIKTIPVRYHDRLKTQLETLAQVAPFDQQALKTVLANNYNSSGYNLRRLTRDQTNKLIGNLSQARQQQIGITHYVWQTSEDERVRDSHSAKNGKTFRWDQPPPDTGTSWTGHSVSLRRPPRHARRSDCSGTTAGGWTQRPPVD